MPPDSLKKLFRHAFMLASVKGQDPYIVFDPDAIDYARQALHACIEAGDYADAATSPMVTQLEYSGYSNKGSCPMFRLNPDSAAYQYLKTQLNENHLADALGCDTTTVWKGVARERMALVNLFKHYAVLVAADETHPYAYVVFGNRRPTHTLADKSYEAAERAALEVRDNGLEAPIFKGNSLVEDIFVDHHAHAPQTYLGFYVDKQSPEYRMLQLLKKQETVLAVDSMEKPVVEAAIRAHASREVDDRAMTMGEAFRKALLVIDDEKSDRVQVVFDKESAPDAVRARNLIQRELMPVSEDTRDALETFDAQPCERLVSDANAPLDPEQAREHYPIVHVQKHTKAYKYLQDRRTDMHQHLPHYALAEGEDYHQFALQVTEAQVRNGAAWVRMN